MSKTRTSEKLMSLAEGLEAMSKKGRQGPQIKLTKKRARLLRDIIVPQAIEYVSVHFPKDMQRSNDYLAACNWILQQIQIRWSQFELADDTKRKKK